LKDEQEMPLLSIDRLTADRSDSKGQYLRQSVGFLTSLRACAAQKNAVPLHSGAKHHFVLHKPMHGPTRIFAFCFQVATME
jgi:hypothetical protein